MCEGGGAEGGGMRELDGCGVWRFGVPGTFCCYKRLVITTAMLNYQSYLHELCHWCGWFV